MSSYNLPLPVGSDNATGAEAVAIAAQPAGVNNNGNATDSAGNLRIDFVHGSRPAQPNDERAEGTPTVTYTYGGEGNAQWTNSSTVPSARLNPALGNHSDIIADWAGFPGFIAAAGNYMVTAASGNGTTITYTSQNKLAAGDVVNITGLTAGAYNISGAIVATANKLQFTVTDATNAGLVTGQWYGKVESTTAASDADGSGLGNATVPTLIGLTLASATDAIKDAGLVLGTVAEADNEAGATSGNNGKIKLQATAAGTAVATGTAVNLTKYVYTA